MWLKFSVIFGLLDIICVSQGFLNGRYDLFKDSMREPECGSLKLVCRDFTNAILCDRVQFCMDTKWWDIQLDLDQSEKCESCRSMIFEAQLEIEGKTNEYMTSVLTDNLDVVCATQLFGYVKCRGFVDKFVPAILTVLSSHQLDSLSICYLFLECNSDGRDSSSMTSGDVYGLNGPFDISTSTDLEDTCDECKDFALAISNSVRSMGKNAYFMSRIRAMCSHLSSPICKIMMMKQVTPRLHDWLSSGPTVQQFCYYVGMCDSGLNEIEDDFTEDVYEYEKYEMFWDGSNEPFEDEDIYISGASPLCPLHVAVCLISIIIGYIRWAPY